MDDWTQGIIKKSAPGLEIMDWWEKDLAMLSKKARRLKAALMIYAAWNIWKARNRKVFQQKLLTPGRCCRKLKRRCVAELWPVDDLRFHPLMFNFYFLEFENLIFVISPVLAL